jgi:hypothetical protein
MLLLKKLIQEAIRRTEFGSYQFRYRIGAVERPHYAYLVYQAAQLAARLQQSRVSVIEFGVARGAGLIVLEKHAEQIEKLFPVKIDIYGFDTGAGLPSPEDYRDLPYHWKAGFFRMDLGVLKKQLKRAQLIIGDVRETADRFFREHNPAPVGAISQDLDFYSSTIASLRLFDSPAIRFLPRVFCYFDDTIGGDIALYNDFTGQRLAIHDFNNAHERVKLSSIYYLRAAPITKLWHHKMWSAHLFDHPQYTNFVSG